MGDQKVVVLVYENLGYEGLEKYLVKVFDNLPAANLEYNMNKHNKKKKFLIMKTTTVRRYF